MKSSERLHVFKINSERGQCRWQVNFIFMKFIVSECITMDLEEVGRGCGDWMELAQVRDRWRALVSTVMNFGVS